MFIIFIYFQTLLSFVADCGNQHTITIVSWLNTKGRIAFFIVNLMEGCKGVIMLIREKRVKDVENFKNLIKEVENHSDFMLMEAGERKTTSEQQCKQSDTWLRLAEVLRETVLI